MNFVIFNLVLLLASFPAGILFSLGIVACLAPLALFARSQHPPKAVMYPVFALGAAFQIYFWGFWAAICVAVTMHFTRKPEVTWDWLYWMDAFSWCTALIGWFAHKERQTSKSEKEARGIAGGAMLYSLVAIAAFLLFAFRPSLMGAAYGWALRVVGLSSS